TYAVPNISTELSNMRLFASYALRKILSLHLDYILNRFKTNEWTWDHWAYTDGSRLTQDIDQIINFIGLSGHLTWQ
ncbi:MAG: MtrB/PioB family outer membrane beta-barrel protein, partial [Nitrosomonas sp.]